VTSTAERTLTGAWRFFAAWKFFHDRPRVLPYLRPYWKLAVGSVTAIGFGVLAGLVPLNPTLRSRRRAILSPGSGACR
jgi:hypothetical protein